MASGGPKCWSSPEGLEYLKGLLKRLLPQWKNGPHDWQIASTAYILDGLDQFTVVACGEGKTAASYLHHLVLQELADHPELDRCGTKIRDKPVTLFVSPLSDLSLSQVSTYSRGIGK